MAGYEETVTPFEHRTRTKLYVINLIVWLLALAMMVALVYEIGAWLMHHWKFPGLP